MAEAHVVSEFMLGNTRIKIADNNCRKKSACDVERILTQIARRAHRYFSEPTSLRKEDTDNGAHDMPGLRAHIQGP